VSLTVNTGELDIPLLLALGNLEGTKWFPIGCNPPYRASNFSTFGWFSSNMGIFTSANYLVDLFWYPPQASLGNLSLYLLSGHIAPFVNITSGGNNSFIVHGQPQLTADSLVNLNITTAFNSSTSMSYAIIQFQGETETSFGEQSFTYDSTKPFNNLAVNAPSGLSSSSSKTFIRFTAYDCNMKNNITTWVTFTVPSSSSSSSGLSTGAIVGIVCACVLIIGIATWWICMRRRKAAESSSGYTNIEEENK